MTGDPSLPHGRPAAAQVAAAGSGRLITTAEAASRLGVKPSTLYAYVSRGMLTSSRGRGGTGSLFDAGEVERLAARSGSRGRAGRLEVVIDSSLTMLDPAGRLYYRGVDVVELCREASFELAAELLWTGNRHEPPRWAAPAETLAIGRSVQRALPAAAGLVDRIRATAAAIGPADPLRHDRHPAAVAHSASGLVTALVECLPILARGESGGSGGGGSAPEGELRLASAARRGSIAARLWPRLSPLPPRPADLAALNGALVLLADHELAASTLAARVAASTWADPYLVVLAGLGALGGPLHGGASNEVARLLAEARRDGVPSAVGEILRTAGAVPGFGHRVYLDADPRAAALLGLVAAARPDSAALVTARSLIEVMSGREGGFANVDLALVVLAGAGSMVPGSGEAIFAVARSAGFVAHAIEEYGHRLRFRPRAAYVGVPPADGGGAGDGLQLDKNPLPEERTQPW